MASERKKTNHQKAKLTKLSTPIQPAVAKPLATRQPLETIINSSPNNVLVRSSRDFLLKDDPFLDSERENSSGRYGNNYNIAAATQSEASFVTLPSSLSQELVNDPSNPTQLLFNSPSSRAHSQSSSQINLEVSTLPRQSIVESPTPSLKRRHPYDDFKGQIKLNTTQLIRAVGCVGRLSGHQKQDIVKKIQDNNEKLYAKFQATEHSRLHSCDPNDCPAEFRSFVFNGWSSNTDITKRSGQVLEDFKSFLTEYATEDQATIVVFSSTDGLFTNISATKKFFSTYSGTCIVFAMYMGGSNFMLFYLNDLVGAISDIENRIVIDSPVHQLVTNWAAVSINKLQLSQAHRDNRVLAPRRRNTIDTDDETSLQHQGAALSYTDNAKRQRRIDAIEAGKLATGNGALKYELVEIELEQICCPEAYCPRIFSNFQDLVDHLASESSIRGRCVLCSGLTQWKGSKDHIRLHLPATLVCKHANCGYEARTKSQLNAHLKVHEGQGRRSKPHPCTVDSCRAQNIRFFTKGELDKHSREVHGEEPKRVPCPYCPATFANKYGMQRHLNAGSCPGKPKPAFKHACQHCSQEFDSYISMRYHVETVHGRNSQIVGFAADAGLINPAALPVPASVMMQAAGVSVVSMYASDSTDRQHTK